jgi:hypothetical protein
MFAIFPALLDFSFLGAFIIRVGLSLFVFLVLKKILQNKIEILNFLNQKNIPTNFSNFIFILWAVIYTIIGALLLVGLFTQIAFLVLALLMIELMIMNRLTQIILVPNFVCLSIFWISLGAVFLGAGAFAFDLPL